MTKLNKSVWYSFRYMYINRSNRIRPNEVSLNYSSAIKTSLYKTIKEFPSIRPHEIIFNDNPLMINICLPNIMLLMLNVHNISSLGRNYLSQPLWSPPKFYHWFPVNFRQCVLCIRGKHITDQCRVNTGRWFCKRCICFCTRGDLDHTAQPNYALTYS